MTTKITTRKISKGVIERIYPSGESAYVITFTYRGVTCRETLSSTPISKANDRYATNLKAEIDSRIARETFKYTDYFPESPNARKFGHAVSTFTVKDLLKSWIKDIERSHPHTTHRKYKQAADVLTRHLGKFRATDLAINPEPIKEWIRSQTTTQKTIRNLLTPLRAIFDTALNDNIVERNPMDKIKVKLLVSRAQSNKPKPDPYSTSEILQLIETCKQYKPDWAPYWQFVFFSGVRTSEGYALKWANIDWTKKTILIDSAVVERKEKETKTKSSTRHLPLLPMAEQAIKEQQPRTSMASDYIFNNPTTHEPITDYDETADTLKWLCKKAGLRFRPQRQTRHSFASNMLSGGENPYRVAEMLGHNTVEMVFKVYGTWIDQGKDQFQEYISEYANINTKTTRGLHVAKDKTQK